MKVEKITAKSALYDFFKSRLPDSLEARIVYSGYGSYCSVHAKSHEGGRGWWVRFKDQFDPGIATIYARIVELRAPEYFADFEAVCLEYENLTGEEIVLRYWNSPAGGKSLTSQGGSG